MLATAQQHLSTGYGLSQISSQSRAPKLQFVIYWQVCDWLAVCDLLSSLWFTKQFVIDWTVCEWLDSLWLTGLFVMYWAVCDLQGNVWFSGSFIVTSLPPLLYKLCRVDIKVNTISNKMSNRLQRISKTMFCKIAFNIIKPRTDTASQTNSYFFIQVTFDWNGFKKKENEQLAQKGVNIVYTPLLKPTLHHKQLFMFIVVFDRQV